MKNIIGWVILLSPVFIALALMPVAAGIHWWTVPVLVTIWWPIVVAVVVTVGVYLVSEDS